MTQKKDTKNLTSVYSGVLKNDPERRENDFYPTPPLPVWILGKYTDIPKRVVEPCGGVGNISIELIRQNHDVTTYDLYEHDGPLVEGIITGKDVMSLPPPDDDEEIALVTNPPYHKNLPQLIAEKGITEYTYTALLVRITYLEGMKRKRAIFDKMPPTQMLFFSDRINFNPRVVGKEPVEENENIGGMLSYVWMVWDKRHPNWTTKNTECHWVSLKDEYPEWRKTRDEFYERK